MSLDAYWPKYPKTLEAAQWTKQKGIIAKVIKSDTGIGKILTETEALFDKLPAHYYSRISVDTETRAACIKALKNANDGLAGPLKVFFVKLAQVEKVANDQAKIFSSKILIPKSTTAYVKSIAAAAQTLARDLGKLCGNVITEIKKEGAAAPN